MSKTMKKVSALLLAILMIVTYMPMMQETAYAAKKAKKPAKVKITSAKPSGRKITVKWKKAKNAKKYVVSVKDMSTKLTSSKSVGKKLKFSFNGSYSNSYQIKVRGVNGKKKGSWSKAKTVKVGQDPKLTAALDEAKTNKDKADDLTKQLKEAVEALQTAQSNSATQKEAIEQAKAIIDVYDNGLDDEEREALPDELKEAIEDARAAVKEAEIATATELTMDSWNPEVKNALNAMIEANKNQGKYVVFDFDNTCSIFDVEEQLALHQLRTMSFVITPEEMPEVLATELDSKYFYKKGLDGKPIEGTGEPVSANASYCENKDARYDDWIDDITAAYTKLWNRYGGFTADGVDEATQALLLEDDDWKEFSTKIRTMYDLVYDTESAAVAYPWVLYWFTGMTEEQVYKLAYDSHSKYSKIETERVSFKTPETSKDNTKIGRIGEWGKDDEGNPEFTPGMKFYNGTQVSDNIRELYAALDNNGIDVWVCSASATDPIRAAVDVWGLHDHVKGLMAMTNVLKEDGTYEHAYDWDGGNAWLAKPNGEWEKDTELQKTQTQGKGKVIAIQNVLYPKYDNAGPIAGFMDSTGDYNFCTEFKSLEVVCCFNRADRKQTDGGGVIAEVAKYEADTLKYNYDKARANDDTLYVLQGRDERGLRSLINTADKNGKNQGRATYIFKKGTDNPYVFRSDYEPTKAYNGEELQCMIDNNMSVEEAVNYFAIRHNRKDDGSDKDEKYNQTYAMGFVYGEPGKGLGPKFVDPTYNPAPGVDFSGYHTQD